MGKRYNQQTKQDEYVQEPFSASMPEVQAAQRYGYTDAWHNADGSIHSMMDSATGQRVGFTNNQSPRQQGPNAGPAPLVTSTGGPVSDAALRLARPTDAQVVLNRAGSSSTPAAQTSAPSATATGRLPGNQSLPLNTGAAPGSPAARSSTPAAPATSDATFTKPISLLTSTSPGSTDFQPLAYKWPTLPTSSSPAPNSDVPPASYNLPRRTPQAELPARTAPTSETSLHSDGKTYTTDTTGGTISDASAQNSAARAWDQAHPSRVIAGKVGPAKVDPTNTITATPGSQTYVNGKLLPEGATATATGMGSNKITFQGFNQPIAPGQSEKSSSGATITAGTPDSTSSISVDGKVKAFNGAGNLVAAKPTTLPPATTTPASPFGQPTFAGTGADKQALLNAYPEIGNAGSYANTAFLKNLKPGANTAADAGAALKTISGPLRQPAPVAATSAAPAVAATSPFSGVADLRMADEARINAQNANTASLTARQTDFQNAVAGKPTPANSPADPQLYQPGADPARDAQVNKGLQDVQDAYGMIPPAYKSAPAGVSTPPPPSVATTTPNLPKTPSFTNSPALPAAPSSPSIADSTTRLFGSPPTLAGTASSTSPPAASASAGSSAASNVPYYLADPLKQPDASGSITAPGRPTDASLALASAPSAADKLSAAPTASDALNAAPTVADKLASAPSAKPFNFPGFTNSPALPAAPSSSIADAANPFGVKQDSAGVAAVPPAAPTPPAIDPDELRKRQAAMAAA